jgi:hypothetical protein
MRNVGGRLSLKFNNVSGLLLCYSFLTVITGSSTLSSASSSAMSLASGVLLETSVSLGKEKHTTKGPMCDVNVELESMCDVNTELESMCDVNMELESNRNRYTHSRENIHVKCKSKRHVKKNTETYFGY